MQLGEAHGPFYSQEGLLTFLFSCYDKDVPLDEFRIK